MTTFSDIVKKIDTLPPLSHVVMQIQKLYDDGFENVNVIKLIRLIESDATLTADVLKFVNAPKYGFSKKIASVSQAVTLLGTEIIYGLVVEHAMYERLETDPSPYGITTLQFNDMCRLQSALMFQWYSMIDLRDAQFLSPLALIMEIGKLILSKEIKESAYAAQFRRGLSQTSDVAKYEFELFDTTSYYVSALLFEHWNLESTFVEILKRMDFEPEESVECSQRVEYFRDLLDVVRTAVGVKGILTHTSIDKAAELVKDIGLSENTFLHVAKRLKRHYEQSKGLA